VVRSSAASDVYKRQGVDSARLALSRVARAFFTTL
jgi:hypothetical protein